MKRIKPCLVLALFIVILSSCDKNHEEQIAEYSTLKISLTDSPGDFEAVYVDIQGVKVYSITEQDSGWISLPDIHTGMYDLLKLSNGIDTLLGENDIPSGYVSQIRLTLGPDNYLLTKDDSIHMDTPSAQQSGLKLHMDLILEPNLTYNIKLDFEAAKSIIKAGNSGKYILKPVLRTIIEQTTGSIKGLLKPDSVSYAVYAIADGDSLTTYTNASGAYIISGLKPDIYAVYIDPGENSGYRDTLIAPVGVDMGVVRDMRTIYINKD